MIRNILIRISFVLALLVIASCGGGDSSPVYTTAVIKVNLTGTIPSGTAVAGAGFTLTLPTNVTPAAINGVVSSGVITPSGTFAGGSQTQVYTAATANTPGTLYVALYNTLPAGVTQLGEIATITLQLANGAVPAAGSMPTSTVTVIDIGGNPIAGINAVVASVTLQ